MRKSSALVSFFLLLAVALPVQAQVLLETPTPTRRATGDNGQELRMTLQEKRSDFRKKLQTIRDQRKQTVVENIDQKIQAINTRKTTQMNQAADKLSDILDRVASKGAAAKEQGSDTTTADAAIASAETALSTAKEAIASQAAKTYVIEIVDEATLRNTVGQTISSLMQDLRLLYQTVNDAKHKVVLAAREVAKLQTIVPEASESAQ